MTTASEPRSFRCRVCGTDGNSEVYPASEKMFGLGGRFDYLRCADCGCLQIAEIPADLGAYYPRDYYSLKPLQVEASGGPSAWARRARLAGYLKGIHAEALWSPLFGRRDFFPWLRLLGADPEHRVLDVGAGNGSFLRDLRLFGFTRLTGVDPFIGQDLHYAPGFSVLKRPLEAVDGVFDLITAHHSLEHMADQAAALAGMRARLAPGGRLLVRIPVVPSLAWETYGVDWVGLDAPRHLYLHSVQSLRRLAERAGLRLYHVCYDSSDFQFWASEQYRKGLPLHAPTSWAVNRGLSAFTRRDILRYRKRAKTLNRQGRGDTACFFFKPDDTTPVDLEGAVG